ncbi:hypothetical protein TNCV_3430121 [Trichonephila clavipes]|nr:hypothetical protein TNCV_3430121 [Trichonephila clavipes]
MVRLKYGRLTLFDVVTGISPIGLNIQIGRLKIRHGPTFFVPTSAKTDIAVREYYGRPALFGKVTGTHKIRFQILLLRS